MNDANLKPWRKGVSGNPNGRPPTPPELRSIRSLSNVEVCKLVSKYARLTFEEIEKLIRDHRHLPIIELSIIKIFYMSAAKGDYQGLAFLLDRAIGKPKDAPPMTEEEGLAALSDEELLEVLRERIPQLKAG